MPRKRELTNSVLAAALPDRHELDRTHSCELLTVVNQMRLIAVPSLKGKFSPPRPLGFTRHQYSALKTRNPCVLLRPETDRLLEAAKKMPFAQPEPFGYGMHALSFRRTRDSLGCQSRNRH